MAQSTRLDGSHCRLSADARRARHRDRMQRQRLAEKKNIMDKRAEAERLTRELEHAIQHFCTKLQKQTNVDAQIVKSCVISRKYELQLLDSKLKESAIKCTTLRHMQQRYLSLVLQQSIITEENRRLIKRHREWELFIRLLRAENERLPTPHTLNMDKLLVQHERGGRWVVFSQDEPAIFYQPIARKTCLELACKGYQRMQEMLRGPGAKKLYNEAFGWKVYFSTHRDDSNQLRMQHRFNKKISAIGANGDRITGDTLAKATWEIITTPKLYAQIYRCPMASKVLQNVDAHTSVIMRTSSDGFAACKRFVCLVVQVQDCVKDETPGNWMSQTRRRVTILTLILDPDTCFPHASTHATVEWVREGVSYLSFTEIDDENSVEIEDGGLTNVDNRTASCTGLPFAIMNLGEPLVRWEQLVTLTRTLSIY
ncbi:hypothetical protein Plhal304r1_c014g0052991 [Plasmopara halstedii]